MRFVPLFLMVMVIMAHTAQDGGGGDRDRETMVSILHNVLYTVHRDSDREPLFSIVPIQSQSLSRFRAVCTSHNDGRKQTFLLKLPRTFRHLVSKLCTKRSVLTAKYNDHDNNVEKGLKL